MQMIIRAKETSVNLLWSNRKYDSESGALQGRRLDRKLSMVMLEDDDCKRQTQPHAGVVAFVQGIIAFCREMCLRATITNFSGHADAVISDVKNDMFSYTPHAHSDLTSPGGRIDQSLATPVRRQAQIISSHFP